MSNDQDLVDHIFALALDDGTIGAEREARNTALWTAGIVLLADVLLRSPELTRERLLRGLDRELREALADIPQIMQQGPPALPRYPEVPDGPRN